MPKENEEDLNKIPYPDEAFNTWGVAALGVDPMEASFREGQGTKRY